MNPPPPNQVRFIVACVTWLATICAICGGLLLWKGYQGGDLLVSTTSTAIGGLIGMLSMNRAQPSEPAKPDVPTTPTPQPPTPPTP